LIERLVHYFKTYKLVAGEGPKIVMREVYGRQHARRVIDAAIMDYRDMCGNDKCTGFAL
jgi:inorganic pyrophosphatase